LTTEELDTQLEQSKAQVVGLEKRLKNAESQCQATTREIWQMEVELAQWEERAKAAESRVSELEACAPTPTPDTAAFQELEDARRKLEEITEAKSLTDTRLSELQAEIQGERRELESEQSRNRRQLIRLQAELDQAESEREELLVLRAGQAEIDSLRAQIATLEERPSEA
jgi:chromosome segregation ATPase